MARIVGASRFSTAADTYARIVFGVEQPDNPHMRQGRLLEPGIRAWVEQERRTTIEPWHVVDDRVPFFGGSPDGVEPGAEVLHEIKTTGLHNRGRWGVIGTDATPIEVFIQCQWYMGLVPSARECFVWVYFVGGNDDPIGYHIARNDESIAALRERCEAWWFDHIIPRKPPPVEALESGSVDALYPKATGDVLALADDSDVARAAAAYNYARAQEKDHKAEKETAATVIKSALGAHKGAKWPGGSVSWTERKLAAKTNWEAVAYELAQRGKIPGEVFNGLVNENTNESATYRALSVTIKRK